MITTWCVPRWSHGFDLNRTRKADLGSATTPTNPIPTQGSYEREERESMNTTTLERTVTETVTHRFADGDEIVFRYEPTKLNVERPLKTRTITDVQRFGERIGYVWAETGGWDEVEVIDRIAAPKPKFNVGDEIRSINGISKGGFVGDNFTYRIDDIVVGNGEVKYRLYCHLNDSPHGLYRAGGLHGIDARYEIAPERHEFLFPVGSKLANRWTPDRPTYEVLEHVYDGTTPQYKVRSIGFGRVSTYDAVTDIELPNHYSVYVEPTYGFRFKAGDKVRYTEYGTPWEFVIAEAKIGPNQTWSDTPAYIVDDTAKGTKYPTWHDAKKVDETGELVVDPPTTHTFTATITVLNPPHGVGNVTFPKGVEALAEKLANEYYGGAKATWSVKCVNEDGITINPSDKAQPSGVVNG